ncbi:hypothetical protein CR513_36224, partial [Mucuna pruriens]
MLSKRHVLLTMLEAKLLGFECIKELYLVGDDFKEVYELCANSANRDFYRHDGFLFKEKRLCVPKSFIRELLVKEAHESDLLGHFGENNTYYILQELFFWPHMKMDLHHICDRCLVCKVAKSKIDFQRCSTLYLTINFLVTFGGSFGVSLTPSYSFPPLVILKQMETIEEVFYGKKLEVIGRKFYYFPAPFELVLWGSNSFNVINLSRFGIGTQVSHLRTNSLQKGEHDMDLDMLREDTHEGKESMETKELQDPITRGRMRKLKQEVYKKMGQGGPTKGLNA